MKKAFFACVCMFAAAVPAGAKIGVVNLETLIKKHPGHESNRTLVKSTADDFRKKMELRQERAKELVEEGKKMQTDWQNPMLSATAKADLQKKLEDVQRRLFAVQQEMRAEEQRCQEELSDLQQRLFKIEKKDVESRIEEYAKENGYDLIVDAAACGFFKPEFDVTDSVLKKMGAKSSGK